METLVKEGTAKVTDVLELGTEESTWNGEISTYYGFKYTLDNGVTMKARHKSPSPFGIGEDVQFKIKGDSSQYGSYGSVGKPQATGNAYAQNKTAPSTQKRGGNGSFALAYAKDMVVSLSGQYNDPEAMAKDAVAIAEKYLNPWLNNN